MNTFMVLERLFSAIIGCGAMGIFFFGYGEYKISRGKAFAMYFAIMVSIGFLYKLSKLLDWSDWVVNLLMVLVIVSLDLLYILLAKGKWYLNWLIIEIYFFVDGIFVTIEAVICEVIFEEGYNAEPMVYNLRGLLIGIGINIVMISIKVTITTLIMRKLFPYKKIQKGVVGNNIYWSTQLFVAIGIQAVYAGMNPVFDIRFALNLILLFIIPYAIIHFIYTFTYIRYNKRMIAYAEEVLDSQRHIYEDLIEAYNNMRDIKHDLANYMSNIGGLKEDAANRDNYVNELNDKIENLNRRCDICGIVDTIKEQYGADELYRNIDIEISSCHIDYGVVSYPKLIQLMSSIIGMGLAYAAIYGNDKVSISIDNAEEVYSYSLRQPVGKKQKKIYREHKDTFKKAKKVMRCISEREEATFSCTKKDDISCILVVV